MMLTRTTNATLIGGRRNQLAVYHWEKTAIFAYEVFASDRLFHAEVTMLKRTLSLQLMLPFRITEGHRTIALRRFYRKTR